MKRLSLLFLLACLIPFYACDEPLDPEIRLFENEYPIGAEGGELIVRFAANVEVTVSANVGWITVMDLDEMNCLLSVDPNPEGTERTGKVVFSNYENGITASVWVNQEAGEVVTEEKSELEFEYTAQTFTVNVTSLSEPEVKTSADWISYTGATSGTNKVLSFSLKENQGKEPRQADVRITAGKQVRNIAVTQLVTTYAPATKEEIEKSEKMGEEVANSVQNILSGTSESTPAENIAEQIEQLDEVVYAHADDEGENIRFMKRDSTFTTVVLHPEKYGIDVKAVGKSSQNKQSYIQTRPLRIQPSLYSEKKVLLLSPFQSSWIINDEEHGNRSVDYMWIESELNNLGIKLDYYLDDKADIGKFRADFLSQYDVVLVLSHGGSWTSTHTRDNVPPFTICTTGTSIYDEWPDSVDPDLYKKLETILIGPSHRYVITSDFLDCTRNGTVFNSTLVYMGICEGYKNPDFKDFFITRGKAAAYAGFSDVTRYRYAEAILYSICRSLFRGMSIVTTINYVERDPELQTSEMKEHAKNSGMFSFDIDVVKGKTTLVDPTPFNLEQRIEGDQAALSWSVNHTTGTYRYTVIMDGKTEYSAGSAHSLKVPQGAPGEHSWQVKASLYIGNELIDTYISDAKKYNVTETPYFKVTTGEPIYVFDDSATFDVTYQTNQNLHVFSGGVVYSSEREEPDLEKAYCQHIYSSAQDNPFRVKVEPLNGGTKYYARGYVITGASASTPALQRTVQYGDVVAFETFPDAEYPVDAGIEVENEYGQKISSVDFGNVDLGQTPSVKIYLWNKSMNTRSVKVKSVSEGFSVSMQPMQIEPNYAAVPVITFHPTMGAIYSGSVVFDLGEGFNPVEVKLYGTGVPLQAEFTFSTSSLSFGEVEVGQKAHLPVVISNIGKQSGFITNVVLPEGFGSGFYQAFPLPVGEDYNLEIVFMPTEAKYYGGDVIIYTDNAQSGFRIAVEGYGTTNTVPVTGVTLDKQELTLTVGDKYTLQASIKPANATNKDVTWKSLDTTVATVSNGVVTAIKPGQANIVVTTVDGSHTALCRVTVRSVNGGHEGTVEEDWGNN